MKGARWVSAFAVVGLGGLLAGCCLFSGTPTVEFSYSPSEPMARSAVQFSGQSTGTITSWNWEFGDGGTSSSQNPSHTYQRGGTYNVRLTVTDNCGKVASRERTITVGVSLTGNWRGTFWDGAIPLDLSLNIHHSSGGSISGSVSIAGLTLSITSGSYIGGSFRASFVIGRDTLTLVGRYEASSDALSGHWEVGGARGWEWSATRL